MKKGRHRRYEEARAMKRGPDLDIEAIFDDLESDRGSAPVVSPPLGDPVDDGIDDDGVTDVDDTDPGESDGIESDDAG